MSFRLGKAIAYAVLIWIVGFVWGSIVFMMPALKSVPSIPYISSNPAISFPILMIWLVLTYSLARSFLKTSEDKAADGLRLGLVLWIVNVILDLVVLVFLLKTGFRYFASATVIVAYLMLVVLPWLIGRSMQRKTA